MFRNDVSMKHAIGIPGIRLRHLPNSISAARLLCVPVLAVLASTHRETPFAVLLVVALISDIVDGAIARRFHLSSPFGALLDSIADFSTLCVAIYGIVVFHSFVLSDHRIASTAMICMWGLECVLALLLYGRLSSFHTYASKVAAYLLGIFVGILFLFGFKVWLFYLAVVTSIASNFEEILLLRFLPQWRTDVRGLWWVLRERRTEIAT